MKLGLFKTDNGDHLLIVIHHLVVDGVSWRILLEDFTAAYQQLNQGKEIELQGKTDSFASWSRQLTVYAESKRLLEEINHWQELEVEAVQLEPLPKDWQIGQDKKKQKYAESVTVNLDKKNTELLLKKVNRAYNTEINDILLTALAMAVKEWAGLDRVFVNLEGHGREPIIEGMDISRTVGWFTTLYPVILDMRTVKDLSYAIRYVKEILRRVPHKGIGYGILKYLTPWEKKQTWPDSWEFKTEPEITFNYLGQFDWESDGDDSFIKISPMHPGEIKNPEMEGTCPIDINGMVMDGKLSLVFTYNQYEYRQGNMEKLAESYRSHLLDIVDHCNQKKEQESTPSDMGYSRIKIEEIDEYEDEFSDLD